jgi:DNA-binding NtrC family response regulator/tetratricopeptide (TPR) repeat protein
MQIMAERFEGYDDFASGWAGRERTPDADLDREWERLEAVGDLHYHAAAYVTALDYYCQILPDATLDGLPVVRALALLRKTLNAYMSLGRMEQADRILVRAQSILKADAQLTPTEQAYERALFMVRQAVLCMQRGDYQAGLEFGKRAFAVLALTDRHTEVANLQFTMGCCQQRLGRLDKAEEFYQDSLSTFRRVGSDVDVASLYGSLALLRKVRCRWSEALDLLDQAVSLAQRHGAPQLLSGFFLSQGIICIKIGRHDEARGALNKALRLCMSLGDQIREPKVRLALGRLEFLEGRLARAEEFILEGQHLADNLRMRRESVIADEYLGDVQLARGDTDRALANYGAGFEKCQALGQASDLEAELLRRVAEAQRRAGRVLEAIGAAHAAIAVCEKCGEDYELGFCRLTLGNAYAAQTDWEQADAHFRASIEVFRAQNLNREWCGAILAYENVRLASADKPILLLLRRFLLEAQEQGAADVDDVTLCACLEGLIHVQMRLGLCDDALLTVFELERHARGLEDGARLAEVERLRRFIEAGMVGGLDGGDSPLTALSGIPGLFSSGDGVLSRNLGAVLTAAMAKAGATCGFFALGEPGSPDTWGVTSRQEITENLAAQVLHWFAQRDGRGAAGSPLLVSRLGGSEPLAQAVPALCDRVGSCVFLPVAIHDRVHGFLFLGNAAVVENARFDQPLLDYLSTCMGFVALFLAETARCPAAAAGGAQADETFGNVITRDERMFEVLALIRKVAPYDLTVLLRGETGTGKGLLAYALHALSRRAARRFLAINCAAIPETLLESELFGHQKGSFTGADADKKGLIVEAEGGTVFLDEIGKMPLVMQGKVLHFLDNKVVRPVGSAQERQVDVRIVCASKSDLCQMVEAGRFLEDLYFRLLDFPIVVPPLRERPGDIRPLAETFVARFAAEFGVPVPGISSACLDALSGHHWPGNVRELEKCLKRALVLAQGEPVLRPEHLPRELVPYLAGDRGTAMVPLKDTLAEVESREIARALRLSAGNKSAAARLLRISYPNLLKKIRYFGLQD